MMRFSTICAVTGLSLLCLAPGRLSAVRASGGQSAPISSWAPDEVTAWDQVGSIDQLSGVYLGNYGGEHWVLTAAHVGSGTVKLGDYSYSGVAGSTVAINPVGGTALMPDLLMFRINPGNAMEEAYLNTLAILELVETPLAVASEVRLIGHGDNNASAVTKSWGDNEISGTLTYSLSGGIYGGTGYYTLDANGVRAVIGDSGGGVFYWTGSSWALAGIMSAADDIGELGRGMVAVPLYLYADQILAAVPEPAALAAVGALLAFGSVLVGRRRNRVRLAEGL